MQAKPAFSIGIDLGTTNCALSFVDLKKVDEGSAVLSLPQRSDLLAAFEGNTLPSFLYLPTEGERSQIGSETFGLVDGWLVGIAARQRSLSAPDRVAHSAKSWLCHHTVDPQSRILPWKSESIIDAEKLSPLEVTTRLLVYLKQVWDERRPEHRLACQDVTITVPASFDLAAQRATLQAARAAGYPDGTRLLEEPQAAFYRWLEGRGKQQGLEGGQRILVVDIGGGTSDFSLFEVGSEGGSLKIERIAVSDHILLGGDNIDLALAHALESELVGESGELSTDQWGYLIARARELKELCLAGEETSSVATVSVPSRGSGLMAGTLSAEVVIADVRALLLDGFFPVCPASATPDRPSGGLMEWGLPYAPDCAVTRYLADFLTRCGGRVDAVLFNGGTLASRCIQKRLLEQLGEWQGGEVPRVLDNAETDLAVARGAAACGAIGLRGDLKIVSGLARAVYLEVGGGSAGKSQLLCVLPRGQQAGVVEEIRVAGLRLATNRRVRFGAWQGDLQDEGTAGKICYLDTGRFARLPALEALIELEGNADESLAVSLRSSVNELGLLQVECVSLESGHSRTWALEFNLRGDVASGASVSVETSDVDGFRRADSFLKQQLFAASPKASRIMKGLEADLGKGRAEWSLPMLRQFADTLFVGREKANRTSEQKESWLQLAGYFMRPGFGYAGDEARLDRLWNARVFVRKSLARVEVQEAILWRRVAGGLGAERQASLLEAEWELARSPKKATAERIRLLGALERVELSTKSLVAGWCLEEGLRLAKEGGYAAPYFSALGQLLSRTPFRAGVEYVLPPEQVVQTFDRVGKLDWREGSYVELISLFLRAARVVDDRALDVPERARGRIRSKLEKSGVAASTLGPLSSYQPLTLAEQAKLFGEDLPVGLRLG